MSGKATRGSRTRSAAVRIRAALSRLTISAVLALVFVTVVLGAFAASPYFFKATTIENEIANQLRATTGLTFASESAGRFVLFPRPRVELGVVHVSGPNGTLTLDADALEGDVRLLPLVVGRIELVSATLARPRLTIDLDGKPMPADSLIGRAMYADQRAAKTEDPRRLGIVSLTDGTATLKSGTLPQSVRFTEVNVTLDWRDIDSPATLTGALRVRDVPVDLAAWIAQPAALMRGDHSAMSLHVHAAPLDLSGSGDLVRADTTAFRGHVTASAPSIAALLALGDTDLAIPAPFANFALDSDAAIALDQSLTPTLNLQNLTMHEDGNELEGTLAFQGGQRPSLSGTLASEQLSLAPFLVGLQSPVDARRHWSKQPFLEKPPHLLDLDLRLSATHLRVAQYAIDDAALAVITRSDRTEITLADGKAYGGTLKGRCSIGVADTAISLHATGSLTDADAATLSWDGTGRQLAAGALSGSLSLDTSGASPAEMTGNLRGTLKITGTDGEISGIDFARALAEAPRLKTLAFLSALRSGRTAFSKTTLTAQIADGIATIDDGTLNGPDVSVALGGTVNLGDRGFGLGVVTRPAAGTTASGKAKSLRLDIGGTFDNPVVTPQAPDPVPATPRDTR